jgi:predicted MPP superfamily phosphohydrolase
MRIAWATDIHLNFLTDTARQQFLEMIKEQADAFLISGDIAESNDIGEILCQMDALLGKPIYFVLGNHDFYRGSVAATRRQVIKTLDGSKNLVYLSQSGIVELSPSTAMVGHDGWADARLGDFDKSRVILSDFQLIDELRCWNVARTLDKSALRRALQALGDEAAQHLESVLPTAAERYANVLVVTHVPPFREATWHEGRPSDDAYLPFFSCKAVGDVLLSVAKAYPACRILVLCGHTHGGGEVQMLENLQVVTGPAEYGKPRIQQIFSIK